MKKTMLSILTSVFFACLVFAQPQEDMFTACLAGDLDGVKKAVENGADVNAPNSVTGQGTLAYAYFSAEITAYLLEQGCDPNGGNYPALVSASSVASLEVMKLLLDNGADPNMLGGNETPMFKIVQMTNCAECAELLLSKGADISISGGVYTNLIGVYASYGSPQDERKESMKKYGDVLKGYGLTVPDWYYNPSEQLNAPPEEMLKVLVKNGYDINARTKLMSIGGDKEPGEPALFTAMNLGKKEIIFSFLNNGVDYNATYRVVNPDLPIVVTEGRYSPLMYASIMGYMDVVKWLLEKLDLENESFSGLIVNEKNVIMRLTGISAIYLAIMYNDMELVKMLAGSSLKWNDYVIKSLPGQKFDNSYGSKPKVYQFTMKKSKSKLRYSPSLYADFSGKPEMAEYLRSMDL